MSMLLQKKGDPHAAHAKAAEPPAAASKAKGAVTAGAGFDAQTKQLAPSKDAKGTKGIPQGELDGWLAVTANLIKVKPEGSPEANEHLANGRAMLARASSSQAKVLHQKIAELEAVLTSDMVGNDDAAADKGSFYRAHGYEVDNPDAKHKGSAKGAADKGSFYRAHGYEVDNPDAKHKASKGKTTT